MTALPKPEARGSKPRKRIARKSERVPVRKCPAESTIRKARVLGEMPSHRSLVKLANDLWREIIYAKEPSGVCPCCRKRWWHDAAHDWEKGAYPWMRFDPYVAAPLCRPCHRRIDDYGREKEAFFARYTPKAERDRLKLLEITHPKLDMQLVVMWLRAEQDRAKARVIADGYQWPVRPPRENG